MTFKEDGIQERDQAVWWPQGAPAPPLPKVTGVSRSPPICRDPLRTHQNVKPKISYLGKSEGFFSPMFAITNKLICWILEFRKWGNPGVRKNIFSVQEAKFRGFQREIVIFTLKLQKKPDF